MQNETNATEQQTNNPEQLDNLMPAYKMKTRSMARATRSSAATDASNPEEPTADDTEKHPQIDVAIQPFEVEGCSKGAATEELKGENEVPEQPEKVTEEMPAMTSSSAAKDESEPQPIAHPVAEEA